MKFLMCTKHLVASSLASIFLISSFSLANLDDSFFSEQLFLGCVQLCLEPQQLNPLLVPSGCFLMVWGGGGVESNHTTSHTNRSHDRVGGVMGKVT